MVLKNGLQVAMLMLVGMFIFSCDLVDDESNGSLSVDLLQSGSQVNLKLADGGEYKVIPYWTSKVESLSGYSLSAGTASVTDDSSNQQANSKMRANTFASKKPDWISEGRYKRMIRKYQWDTKMRNLEQQIMLDGLMDLSVFKIRGKLAKKSAECGDDEVSRGDECLDSFPLKFMDFSGDISDLNVEVRGKGMYCAVVVDEDDDVSQADIDTIIKQYDTIIYPRDHFIFGSSVIDGVDYTDRDGDGLHMIVLSSLVNDTGAVGLFNPNDFITGKLNDSDILWVAVPDADNSLDSLLGTVAHEYFHMIIFGVKMAKFGSSELLWSNEALAHLAEDCSGFGVDNIDTAKAYLASSADYSLAFSGDEIEARGMGFLYMRYLFEQKGGVSYSATDGAALTDNGGAAFLTSLIHTSKTGFDMLDASLGSSWSDYFGDWLAAVTLDNLDSSDAKYQYDDLYSDPLTGQEIGVCTNCTRTNGDGSSVSYSGLSCTKSSGTTDGIINATGADCVHITGAADINLNIEADESDVMFNVIKVK